MLMSMTGFGSAILMNESLLCKAEIRSLNSKSNELNMKLPPILRDKESELRSFLNENLLRGKTDINIQFEVYEKGQSQILNVSIIKGLIEEIKNINPQLKDSEILPAILSMPECRNAVTTITNDTWIETVKEVLQKALDELQHFREKEGNNMTKDILRLQEAMLNHETQIKNLTPLRIDNIQNKLQQRIQNLKNEKDWDPKRFEQEMIFYLEKLDINEEIVRLNSHHQLFKEVLQNSQTLKGKKLHFIAQEMGREINTIGSKANDAEIQRHVVHVKDYLEQIKELLNNIL